MPLDVRQQLAERYAGLIPEIEHAYSNPVVDTVLEHRSVRAFRPDPLPPDLLEVLLACAQSAPTKSDLQGMSVVAVESLEVRQALAALIPSQPWIARAPLFLVWCPDMRRNQEVCRLRGKTHRSNTLDTFLNVSVDTALCMQNFVIAAESLGMGTCNISGVRSPVFEVSRLLALPPGVYPLAGTCVGYPAERPEITPRLPQPAVLHRDRYDSAVFAEALQAYDRARLATHPYPAEKQMHRKLYADVPDYGWLEHTARRMEQRERPDFRAYIESQGFSLD